MALQAAKKHRFGKAWMQEHVNDHWVQEATAAGYRSRAAFKLLELAERDQLFRPGLAVVDLGAAPGSWTQVLRGAARRLRRGSSRSTCCRWIRFPGSPFVQADFREQAGVVAVEAALAGRRVDLVLSDMAPNLSGVQSADQARSVHLGELALEFAAQWLQPGGDFVVKVFQGEGFPEFQRAMQRRFEKAYVRKPKSSRDRSREVYLVGKRHRAG